MQLYLNLEWFPLVSHNYITRDLNGESRFSAGQNIISRAAVFVFVAYYIQVVSTTKSLAKTKKSSW